MLTQLETIDKELTDFRAQLTGTFNSRWIINSTVEESKRLTEKNAALIKVIGDLKTKVQGLQAEKDRYAYLYGYSNGSGRVGRSS